MSFDQLTTPPRLFRLGAAAVNLLPASSPLLTLLDYYIDLGRLQHAPNWGRLAIAELLVALSGLAAIATLTVNAISLSRRRSSIGLRYFGLEVEGAKSGRLLFGETAVLAVPPLLGFVIFLGVEKAVSDDVAVALGLLVPAALYACNFAVALGRSRRTLGDRLGGGFVRRVASEPSSLGSRISASDVVVIALPCVGLPALLIEPVLPLCGPLVSLAVAFLVVAKHRHERAGA